MTLTLFIKAEAIVVNIDKGNIKLIGFLPNQFNFLMIRSNNPLCCIPLLIIIVATTVTTAGLENPKNALLIGITPVIDMMNKPNSAMKS